MKKITGNRKKNQVKSRALRIKSEMSGKGLTTNAGLLPVLKFMQKLGFRERISKTVTIERSLNAKYDFSDIVQMTVVGLIAGATSMEHIVTICKDEVIRFIAGWEDVPVPTSVCRIMKLVSFRNVVELEEVNHRFRVQIRKKLQRLGYRLNSFSSMWIDVDSTVEGTCGNQEGAEKGYNPKRKGQKSYHPLMAFVSETKEVLHSWFRCGNVYTSNGVVEFMKEVMAHTKKGVRIIFRGDSGFFSGSLLDYLETVKAGYLIRVKLKNLSSLFENKNWLTCDKGWEGVEFQHKCKSWSSSRRFVAVRHLIRVEKGLINMPVYDYFCYVTTEELSPMDAHRKYMKRATCETWIEECKSQMRAGNIRTSGFLANAALFQSAVLAYNILKWMSLLTGGEVQKWEIKTIRLYLIRLAGKLIKTGRRYILKLPERFLFQKKWQQWETAALL